MDSLVKCCGESHEPVLTDHEKPPIMTISTTVYVEQSDLGLIPTIRSLDDADIGVVPNAGTDPEHNVYFFWIDADDFGAVTRALEQDHTVADFTMVSETPERRTYRITYADEARLISPMITELDGIMRDSRNQDDGWIVELLLPEHNALYELGERVAEEGIGFKIMEIHQKDPNTTSSEFRLTESQTEALVSAYEHGYYEEPREISLEELGSVLDISRNAVSGRLRRASSRLIEESLGYEDDDDE
jgi:predicted DNA binding protein